MENWVKIAIALYIGIFIGLQVGSYWERKFCEIVYGVIIIWII